MILTEGQKHRLAGADVTALTLKKGQVGVRDQMGARVLDVPDATYKVPEKGDVYLTGLDVTSEVIVT